MALIRIFIAIELPPELKNELATLEAQLKKNMPPVIKWVDADSIHITLKFLGETSDAIVEDLMLAMEEAVQGVPPFQLQISRLGAFPGLDRTNLFWVGVGGELEKLLQVQKNIEANTEPLGFRRERQVFSPHLTLGRVRESAWPGEIQRIGKILADTPFSALHNIDVCAISLMKSVLTSTGPIYSCLGKVKLG
jgi:2'-5' RNA ligase